MRPQGNNNPLDLNNFPAEDYTRDDGKLHSEDSSSSAVIAVGTGRAEEEVYCSSSREKKSSGGDGGGDGGGNKVYECRFCSLKFCKSQALGGHMNRHRQERETETLNKARQLVLSNDLAPPHLSYVSSGQAIPHGGYHQANNISDPLRSMYPPTRLFPTSSPFISPPPATAGPYMYSSSQRMLSFPSQYPAPPPPQPPHQTSDYYVGHVLPPTETNYTCIGAPVGHGFASSRGLEGTGVGEVPVQNQEEGRLNWGLR